MQFEPTHIPDVVRIKPGVFSDARGYFMESFRRDLFRRHIGDIDFCQDNESSSGYGVIRGLHYQLPPYAQSKLVRAIVGRVLDVAVDLRSGSPTFGRHVATLLSEENKYQQFIPRGFAHGFAVLSSGAIFSYKVDAPYAPEYERSIRFDDLQINIDWQVPEQDRRLSERDRKAPCFGEAEIFKEDP
ncbi:MAG: dTDP-4-dehydrorhamnose 3,5-epimerase [Thermodesulfobacteriota bacterium]